MRVRATRTKRLTRWEAPGLSQQSQDQLGQLKPRGVVFFFLPIQVVVKGGLPPLHPSPFLSHPQTL